MTNPRAAARWAAGRAGLRIVLAGRLGSPPRDIPVARGRQGKPYIPGSDLRFNKTDSSGWAMVALSPGREIGLDMEAHRPVRRASRIAARFFSEQEQARLGLLAEPEAGPGFFDVWTSKEAVLKCDGGGLGSVPMADFTCPPGGGPVEGRWWVQAVQWRPGWSVAVALAGPEPVEVVLSPPQ